MARGIRKQGRLNSARIKTPQNEGFSRCCPRGNLGLEETAHRILWECTLSADLRRQTKDHLDQAILDSLARAGIPTEWGDWPAPLRSFGISGFDSGIVRALKELPIARTFGPRTLIPLIIASYSVGEPLAREVEEGFPKPPQNPWQLAGQNWTHNFPILRRLPLGRTFPSGIHQRLLP